MIAELYTAMKGLLQPPLTEYSRLAYIRDALRAVLQHLLGGREARVLLALHKLEHLLPSHTRRNRPST